MKKLQFGLRTLLCVTAFSAIAFAFWPAENRGPKAANYLYAALTTLLACSFLLTDAARTLAVNRDRAGALQVLNRERLALALAVCGMAPFFAVWLFGLVEPHESSGRLVSRIVRGLAYFAFGTYFPATLCIIGSFKVFFGPGQNPPLMALRLIWGSMAIAVPLVLYFFILPGLG